MIQFSQNIAKLSDCLKKLLKMYYLELIVIDVNTLIFK